MNFFRKNREYIYDGSRIMVQKVKEEDNKAFKTITFVSGTITDSFKDIDVLIKDFIEPIDNLTFYSMYINYMNFIREGVHQDLEFAVQVKESILQSLLTKSYVKEGAGKFVDYDFKLLYKLFPDINLLDISLGC